MQKQVRICDRCGAETESIGNGWTSLKIFGLGYKEKQALDLCDRCTREVEAFLSTTPHHDQKA